MLVLDICWVMTEFRMMSLKEFIGTFGKFLPIVESTQSGYFIFTQRLDYITYLLLLVAILRRTSAVSIEVPLTGVIDYNVTGIITWRQTKHK